MQITHILILTRRQLVSLKLDSFSSELCVLSFTHSAESWLRRIDKYDTCYVYNKHRCEDVRAGNIPSLQLSLA